MSGKRLLLLSSSMVEGAGYLEYPQSEIKDFLGTLVKRVLFIPFAGVRQSWDEYAEVVRAPFEAMGYKLDPVHQFSNANEAVRSAEAIAVGGGNTFHLLRGLYETKLIESMKERVMAGTPYIGWSAGSNVACPTIRTTNDMPIVEPLTLDALGLVPFQINPHYLDAQIEGHHGETREQRIAEFIQVNRNVYVVGLREGSMLRIEGSTISLKGEHTARVFKYDEEAREYQPGDSLEFLLQAD
ncbi:MAG: dipeptidase [Acidobacteriota bacterium]|jgi:dipeptidase E|nr:dipeptidase [Acidobacteriota bacterium]